VTAVPVARPGLRPPTRPPWTGAPDVLRVVWTQPRATIRWMLDHEPPALAWWLVGAASLAAAIADGALLDTDAAIGRWAGLVELLVALAVGYAAWWGAALVLVVFGRARGGAGTTRELAVAVAYGLAPAAASLPFALLKSWSAAVDSPGSEALAAVCMYVLWLWSLATVVLGTAEAHRFSAARAALCGLAAVGFYALLGAGFHLWLAGSGP
jgi:hypothetical protein